MTWLLHHKCHISDPEPGEYGMAATEKYGGPVTLIRCPKCRESIEIIGHEFFEAAIPANDANGRNVLNMPPGFLVPQTRRI